MTAQLAARTEQVVGLREAPAPTPPLWARMIVMIWAASSESRAWPVTSSLSATGSRNAPNDEVWFHRHASQPSNQSVKAAMMKAIAAITRKAKVTESRTAATRGSRKCRNQLTIGDIMDTELATAQESEDVFDAVQRMRNKGVRRMPIGGGKRHKVITIKCGLNGIELRRLDVVHHRPRCGGQAHGQTRLDTPA